MPFSFQCLAAGDLPDIDASLCLLRTQQLNEGSGASRARPRFPRKLRNIVDTGGSLMDRNAFAAHPFLIIIRRRRALSPWFHGSPPSPLIAPALQLDSKRRNRPLLFPALALHPLPSLIQSDSYL